MKIKLSLVSTMLILTFVTPGTNSNAQIATETSHTKHRAQRRAQKRVKIYFYHEPGEYIDLSPVTRYVNAAAPARGAIDALLDGPNEEERRRGFDGLATGSSKFTLGSLSIVRGTAQVNFLVDKDWAGFPGDLAPIRFKTAVEMTLKQFPNIKRVRVTLNGDPNFAED